MSVAYFDRLVSYLRTRYVLVRAGDLLQHARDRKPGDRVPVALTFDDDLLSHVERAAPILTRHGTVGTAFLCGARDPFWWTLLQTVIDADALPEEGLPGLAPSLTTEVRERRSGAVRELAKAVEALEPDPRDALATVLRSLGPPPAAPLGSDGARRLLDAGWEIGFHTRRHDALVGLDDAQLATALRDGRDQLPMHARTFAYPHGKAGSREAAAARAAGYEAAFTGKPDVVSDRSDPYLLGRLQPDTRTLGRFALQLAQALTLGDRSATA
jgi:peptidoglycan/xylan/chitin deacetylase (PgdA/CDA1 family)